MGIDESIRFGILLKTHGYKGDFLLKADFDIPENFKKPTSVFILIEGILVPFFIQSINKTSFPYFIIHFEGIDELNDANAYFGREIFISAGDQTIRNPESPKESNYLGFRVVDKDLVEVGIVKKVVMIPGNPLLVVTAKEGERMIPFHTDLIMEVNADTKTLQIDVPDGI